MHRLPAPANGRLRTRSMRAAALAALLLHPLGEHAAFAAVTAVGNVTPAPPPGGGNMAGSLFVGDSASGTLAITAGTPLNVTTGSVTVGDDAPVFGVLTLTGFGSDLSTVAAGDLTIGNSGAGNVAVSNFARILIGDDLFLGTIDGSTGRLAVSDFGSLVDANDSALVGQAGVGEIDVTAGGRVLVDDAIIGQSATGEGRVTISGQQSLWRQTASMTVGDAGRGVLQVLNQGRLETTNVTIADGATGRGLATVDGAGSRWEIAGTLDVSEPGDAELIVSNGGLVTTTGVMRIGALGRVRLDGGRIDVAAAGGATNQGLIEGGGRIQSAVTNSVPGDLRLRTGDHLVLGSTLNNAGDIDLNGGELEVLGATTNSGDVTARNAVVRFAGGLTNSVGGALAATGGSVDLHGAIANNLGAQLVVGGGSTAVFHDAVANDGVLIVSADSTALMLESLAFGAGAAYSVQLQAGDALADAAPTHVAGSATLNGTLDVQLASGYAPAVGDVFQLLTSTGGVNGAFATESLPSLSGLDWDVNYAANAVTLTVIPGLSADFDGDGDVDATDLALWKTGFGLASGAGKINGDENGDGDVDGADFLAWQRQVGNGAPVGAAGAPVPEPRALALAAAGLVAAAVSRRRRAR